MEQQDEPVGAVAARHVGTVRLGIGLVQGLAGWQLLSLVPSFYNQQNDHQALLWSQRHPVPFAILALWTAFVPLLALAELPRMAARRLTLYLLAALIGLAGLVAYDFWRDPLESNGWTPPVTRIWPSPGLMLGATLGLFIVNQLMEHRARRHPLFTHYAAHFEDSWMRGFQLVVALVYSLLVWGVLELGKALFDLIHLDWFGHMIEHDWFRCPALAVAFAAAVHLTDVRPALLRGMRNVGLTLLAWLLPLVVLLGTGFLFALVFTGLAPLWNTRFAASILLSAVAVTVFYLNAAYNDGEPDNRPLLPLRWAGRIAGPMLLVLSVLAAYAIALRVGQHGWTPQRVRSSAVALVALIYGGGYAFAALSRGRWMKPLERVNVVASLVILAILVALLTPIADPARLAVDSQVERLAAGKVAPGQFDYQFLHYDAGRYGTDALAALVHSADARIAQRARLEQANTTRAFRIDNRPDPATTEPALSHATVYPSGAKLPADFVPANFAEMNAFANSCLRDGSACDIIVWKAAIQGSPLLIVQQRPPANAAQAEFDPPLISYMGLPVYGRNAQGKWAQIGTIGSVGCPGVMAGLRDGKAQTVRPDHDDLQVGGVRLPFKSTINNTPAPCAPPPRPVTVAPAPADARAPARMGPAFGSPGAM